MAKVVDESAGPPLVMIQMMSKTLRVYTRPSSSVIAETGRSSGKVTRQNRCQPVAPSSAAAS